MSRHWWVRSFFVLSAFCIGFWIPVRVLYFSEGHFTDWILDGLTLIVGALSLWNRKWEAAESPTVEVEVADVAPDISSGFTFGAFTALGSDLVVAFPLALAAGHSVAGTTSALILLKLLILKKLRYIRGLMDELDGLHPVAFRLIPLALTMPLLVHLIACAWIFLGSGTAGPESDKILEYVRAVYWTFTTLTTVGYGDISAKTIPQMMFASGTQVVGVAVFGYVLSNVASLLARLDAAREHHMNLLDKVEAYMRHNQLEPQLRRNVRAYFKYMWKTHQGYDDDEVLGALPNKLKSEIALFINREIIEKVPLLKGAKPELLEEVLLELHPQICVPGEKVFYVGEPGDAMYFVHAGAIEISAADGKKLATLKAGGFFGEMALILDNPRSATARAQSYTDLFVLRREAFNKVVARHPDFAAHVNKIAQERLATNKKAS